MAICWRCPECSQISCENDITVVEPSVVCDHCSCTLRTAETLCAICDTPNPWSRRDSLHYLCRECGHLQTFYWPSAS
jgi:hypothetical protein